MAEVHRADPTARRLALTFVGIGLAAGVLLLWGLEAGTPAAARWLREDPGAMVARARLLLLGLAIVMVGPPIAAGVYLCASVRASSPRIGSRRLARAWCRTRPS